MPTTIIHTIDPGGTGDYTSLSAWWAAEGNGYDFVSNDVIKVAECISSDGSADTTKVSISGATTDATRYPIIRSSGVNRHNGIWDTNLYRLVTSDTGTALLIISPTYINIIGIQIQATNTGNAHCVQFNDSTTNSQFTGTVDGCIFRGNGTNMIIGVTRLTNTNTIVTYRNNIVIADSGTATNGSIRIDAVGSTGTVYIYNNTVINIGGTSLGIRRISSNGIVVNNIVYNFGNTNSYVGTFTAGTDYNATDGTDAIGTGSNNLISQSFPFVGGGNYALTSQLSGQNLSSDFTTDILGVTRSGWTRGAFEFVQSTPQQVILII